MKALVLNTGSSSLKWGLFDVDPSGPAGRRAATTDRRPTTAPVEIARAADDVNELASGSVSRIGLPDGKFTVNRVGDPTPHTDVRTIRGHDEAVDAVLEVITAAHVDVVGHRVVHGGERFSKPLVVTDRSMRDLKALSGLAPLHNPHNVRGIEAAVARLPNSVQVAVFDTAFHSDLPPEAFLYALPFSVYRRYGVRRYGFHGISHEYVVSRVAYLMKRPLRDLKLISCHLGNGVSVAAVDAGRSVDTSMGFTPLEGLMMGTRSGDVDPGALLYFMERDNLDTDDAAHLLNFRSGLYGICGASDMQDVENKIEQGDRRARLAFQMFAYRLQKYIGAYAAAMGGVDAVIFTGGIGENSSRLRAEALRPLSFLGVDFDSGRNSSVRGEQSCITRPNSNVEAWVIRTREERLIALQAARTAALARAPLPVLT